ncbi:MAG: c-type cytochrome [Gemmatimonadota bacterium]|nr:c-type cytochrome [Gemmatimonadota bacterium]
MRRVAIAVLLVAAAATFGGRAWAQAAQQAAELAPTPQEIAKGDSIYRGRLAGGTCFTCHQLNAKGLPGLAPDLTDAKWLHGDGSLAFIVATIQKGVAKPKAASAPMLPRGGTNLTDDQVKAVAAYVYSLRSVKK